MTWPLVPFDVDAGRCTDYSFPRWLSEAIAARDAEEAGRKEWIKGVKRRLGLVEIGDEPVLRYRLEMPVPSLPEWMTADVAPGALALPVPDEKRVICD